MMPSEVKIRRISQQAKALSGSAEVEMSYRPGAFGGDWAVGVAVRPRGKRDRFLSASADDLDEAVAALQRKMDRL